MTKENCALLSYLHFLTQTSKTGSSILQELLTIECKPRQNRRIRGRLPIRWIDNVKRIVTNWIDKAQDGGVWKCLEETYVQQWLKIAC